MRDRGTLIVARSLVDHPVLATEPFDRRSAWLWLMAEAAWATRDIVVDRRPVALHVGELVGSGRFLAAKWQWTEPRVRRFLAHLKRERMIELRVVKDGPQDRGITVIKLTSFESWQRVTSRRTSDAPPDARSDAPTDAPELPVTRSVTTDLFVPLNKADAASDASLDAGGVSKPTQDIINIKKESKILRFQPKAKSQSVASSIDPSAWRPDAFERWYEVYPRKKAPKAARRALDKLRVSGEINFPDLLTAPEKFAAAAAARPIAERKFIPYPATWLNDGGYAEEPESCPMATAGAPLRDPSTFTEAEWLARVGQFYSTGEWSGLWGPEPGSQGCKVPLHLLTHHPNRPPANTEWKQTS
jgi:hypothetical protein